MQTFTDYVAKHYGPSWCVAARRSPSLVARYGRVIHPKEYRALELAWEVETYGAPLKSLEKAAPAMLAALREIRRTLDKAKLDDCERQAFNACG